MIQEKNFKSSLVLMILTTLVTPIILGNLLNSIFVEKYINIPLHSGLEVAGGVIAIVISMLFYIKYLRDTTLTHFNYTTIALLSMGIIDIFHGIVMPGKLFVWLHSTAVFFGGLFFITVWLKDIKVSKKTYKIIPLSIIVFAIIFSLVSILFPQIVPDMLNEDKTFSSTANWLNIIGGIGFFIASIKYIKLYTKTANIENLLFVGLTILFGISGILFVSSIVWDAQWWLWHFLRLFAYSIALYFLYIEFNKEVKLIEDTNEKLNEANEEINKYLTIINENVIVSSSDLKGNIKTVSDAFCKISGYSRDELIGKNHSILKHTDMDIGVYKDMWKTLNSNKSWHGEIKNKKKNGDFYWVCATITPMFDKNENKIAYTSVRQDITNKKELERISITDGLTNIYNRRHFNDIFPKIVNSKKRDNSLISFVIMDIDHFKQYNDNYGHQMGDDVLIKVSSCIENSLKRGDDYCFRLGGEEFGVIFNSDTQKQSEEFANILRKNIEELKIEHCGNSASSYVTASMGLVCVNAKDINSVDDIYKQGDDLLYVAKESGRNKVISNFKK